MDKFTLCSRAMVLLGASPITSFDDATAEATVAATLYESVVEDVISSYRWRFASTQYQLARTDAVPLARWEAAYQLEPQTQLVSAVTVDDMPIRFDRYEDKILCNAAVTDIVVGDLTRRVAEAFWPGYFQSVVLLKLAAAFAVPVAEDSEKAALYEGQYLRRFTQAKLTDAQGRTPSKMQVGGLRRYHGGQP